MTNPEMAVAMSAERTAEEWGRLAVSIPGFRAISGILWRGEHGTPMGPQWDPWPDPDAPGTAGCLECLLGRSMTQPAEWNGPGHYRVSILADDGTTLAWGEGPSVGRARIAAAEALGRWPGGEQ